MSREGAQNSVLKTEVESIINPIIESAEAEDLPLQYGRLSRVISQLRHDYSTKSSLNPVSLDHDEEMVAAYNVIKETSDAALRDPKYSQELVLSCLDDRIADYSEKATEISELTQLGDDDYRVKVDQLITVSKGAEFREAANARYDREFKRINNPINKPYDDVARVARRRYDEAIEAGNEEVSDQFLKAQGRVLSMRREPDEAVKARFVQEDIERQMEAERDKYHFAVLVSKAGEDGARKLIVEYKAKQKEFERAILERSRQEHEALLKGSVKNVNEYELVREGMITAEQASLFGYEQLNTYWAHSADGDAVQQLFDLAKAYYPDDERRGLEELAQVGYEKISYLLDNTYLGLIASKDITIRELSRIPQDGLRELEGMPKAVVLAVLEYDSPGAVIREAQCFKDISAPATAVNYIERAYEKDGNPYERRANAQVAFEEIRNFGRSQLYAVSLGLTPAQVRSDPLFESVEFSSMVNRYTEEARDSGGNPAESAANVQRALYTKAQK